MILSHTDALFAANAFDEFFGSIAGEVHGCGILLRQFVAVRLDFPTGPLNAVHRAADRSYGFLTNFHGGFSPDTAEKVI